jgi:RNA polymerase sigma-70 factor (ECF subfamily)
VRNSNQHKDSDVTTDALPLSSVRPHEISGQQAFDALFMAYYQEIYRLLYRLTGTREQAEDIAQETFLRFHNTRYLWDRKWLPDERERSGLRASEGEGNIRAWLYRVASNLAFNLLRGEGRRKRRQEVVARRVVVQDVEEADPVAAALRADERAAVRRVLSALPRNQAQLLILRHAGLSYREVAEVLDVAVGSIGTMLARAEAAFERCYQDIISAEGGENAL